MLVLFAVPLICEPLASQPISRCAERYYHLSQLNLADPPNSETQLEVDVLIGPDHYWELATGEVFEENVVVQSPSTPNLDGSCQGQPQT